jgi:DNA polymerase-3 subunit gamma/tau
VAITPATWADMQALVSPLEAQLLLLGQQHLRTAEVQVKNTTQPRLWLEVTLLGLLPSTLAAQVTTPAAPANVRPSPQTAAPNIAPARVQPLPLPPPVAAPPPQPAADTAPPEASEPPPVTPPTVDPPEPPAELAPPLPPIDPGATADSAPHPELDQLWQQVLATLHPLGTRALMQQQGSLLFFDGTVARIGISSRPLFKMAQGRITNVEAAFQQVTQQKVTVSLEVLPDPKPDEPAPESAAGPGAAAMPPGLPPPPSPEASAPAAPVTRPQPVDAAPLNGTNGDITPPDKGSSVPAAAGTPPPPTPHLPKIATDFDRAVKNFAQFFNGQVVDLDEDVNALISGGREPSDAAAQQPSHPDKDVPF